MTDRPGRRPADLGLLVTYARRRELLAELVVDGPAPIAPRHFVEELKAVLFATAEQDLEGVVAKRWTPRMPKGRRRRSRFQ